jgi:hypothetical protein
MTQISVPEGSLDLWLRELKPYQRSTLEQFIATLSPEEAAERWLTTIGSPNIAGFGGGGMQDPKPYWDRFKAECRKFICDETAYADEKKEILAQSPISKPLLISTMSSLIGASLGTPGTLIAPAVTLMLFTIGAIGRNAYCSNT